MFLWGFKVLRDAIYDNYIRSPKERGKQVGKVLLPAWELIKTATRVLQGSYPSVTLPYNSDLQVRPALTGN